MGPSRPGQIIHPAVPRFPTCTSSFMTTRSFFLQMRRYFLKQVWHRFKRKPRPPSPTASLILPDSTIVQDDSSDDKECTILASLDPDVWREILSYCEVVDIVRVGMTCRSLASVADDPRVWYAALLRISHDKRLPHLRLRIRALPSTALRRKAIQSARLDHLPRGLCQMPFYYTTTRVSLPALYVWGISFLPGGEWLVVLCRKAIGESRVMICRASDSPGQPSTYAAVPDGKLTMCISTDDSGSLLAVSSSSPNETTLGVYVMYGHPPRLERVWTTNTHEIEKFTARGSYIVYGWIDRSHTEPRHLIKVLKFDLSSRELVEHRTIRVSWAATKYNHSYALRITDSKIMVLVSSTSLVAAYNVPPLVSASTFCELTCVEPFWRFPCNRMNPRGVYLVPSLPAVDTPSIAVIYGDRYLFILPSFDSDPPGLHPTYFSTYKYPREMRRPMLLGPQRAFWDLGRGRVGIGPLPTPTQPAFGEDGSWDVTGVNAPEANFADFVHPVLYAGPHNRRVARAAWDEESGRLALFPNVEFQQGGDLSIIIVDLCVE